MLPYLTPFDAASMLLDLMAFFVVCVGGVAVVAITLGTLFPGDRDDGR